MDTPSIESAGSRKPVMVWPRSRVGLVGARSLMARAGLACAVALALAASAGPAVAAVSGQGHLAAGGGPLARSATAGAGWSVVPTSNATARTGQLLFGSCPSASFCMSVGTYVQASGRGVTLAERWLGGKWRVLRTPNPAGASVAALAGVSCTAPSSCTAVGYSITKSGVQLPLAERWNGSRWRLQAMPRPAGSRQAFPIRSEERRVGKECRAGGG